jgi:hypothetical protein
MLTSLMDGSPHVVRFDATTLWHFHAAEWAPSTASNRDHPITSTERQLYRQLRKYLHAPDTVGKCHNPPRPPFTFR